MWAWILGGAVVGAVMSVCYWRGYRTGKRHGCKLGRWAEKNGMPGWWDP